MEVSHVAGLSVHRGGVEVPRDSRWVYRRSGAHLVPKREGTARRSGVKLSRVASHMCRHRSGVKRVPLLATCAATAHAGTEELPEQDGENQNVDESREIGLHVPSFHNLDRLCHSVGNDAGLESRATRLLAEVDL